MTPYPAGTDLNAIAEICRETLKMLNEKQGMTYEQIAINTGANISNVKKFINQDSQILVRNNETLHKIWDYINNKFLEFNPEITKHVMYRLDYVNSQPLFNNKNIYDKIVGETYGLILDMMGVDGPNMLKVCQKMEGSYVTFRHSIYDGYVIMNILQIRKKPDMEKDIWEFINCHKDLEGQYKESSDGIVMPIKDNIYMIGDIERGQGIDYIVLREPFSSPVKHVDGFIVSIDNDRIPFFSKLVCTKIDKSELKEINELVEHYNAKIYKQDDIELDQFRGEIERLSKSDSSKIVRMSRRGPQV